MSRKNYDHSQIEKKWQDKWLSSKIYSPNLDEAKNPFYNLWMFPYPSAEGLHAGHAFASTGSDIAGRYMRMNGKEVFQPIGYDSFGIHSENFAIKTNQTPQAMLTKTISHYEEQLKSLGHGYDWNRNVTTSDVDYYHWTEWVFLQLFKAGLAYRKRAKVNFCPKDKTVLSDEQVMTPKQAGKEPIDANGKPVQAKEGLMVCERCGTVVEKRELEVWFFRITDYSDRLLANLDKINWSEPVKVAQKEWIGKSDGMIIKFKKETGEEFEVFTTRPDTLNAVTFIVQADEKIYSEYENQKTKYGEFTGEYAINPITEKKIPIWKASYVAPGYGTGMVMGVPAHDKRDRDFAKKYHLDVVEKDPDENLWGIIEKKKLGRKQTNYHLRDWGIGRQRYWGCPLPMIYCKKCADEGQGWVKNNSEKMVHKDQTDWDWQGWWPEENLPVVLPEIADYEPEGNGRGPLANHPEFYNVKCPHCGSMAKRETDVADTFLDSSWYFFRYISTENKKEAWSPDRAKKWLPVNLYFGGAEHSVLHLMYARFITMVFKDLSLVDHFEEPFTHFYAHGLMIKDGAKMSKSRGNVVNPDEYIKKYGSDTLRLYLMFMGPMDGFPDFRDTGIEGMERFVNKVWNLFANPKEIKEMDALNSVMHRTIQKVTKDIEIFHYNTAISSIMQFVNFLKENGSDKKSLKVLCQLLAPFAPHLMEEVWVNVLKGKFSVHQTKWPKYDEKYLIDHVLTIVIQIDGKLRSQITISADNKDNKEEILKTAMNDEKVKSWLKETQVLHTIFVPGKLVNFVTK